MIVSGPSSAGKSVFVRKLIENSSKLFEKKFEKIIWCNKEQNAMPKNLKNIEYINELPNDFENSSGKSMLIVLDDMMTDSNSSLKICELFTKHSHHRNLSVILISQNIFHQGRYCRDISLNAKYIVLFKNPRDKTQFNHLARQIYPENAVALQRLYKEITQPAHSYLFIDLTQGINDLLRFHTNIFNTAYSTCFCSIESLSKQNGISTKTSNKQQAYLVCAKNSISKTT